MSRICELVLKIKYCSDDDEAKLAFSFQQVSVFRMAVLAVKSASELLTSLNLGQHIPEINES